MLRMKPGIQVRHVTVELLWGLVILADVYKHFGYDCIVTSVSGDKHGWKSRHWSGHAADTRTVGPDPDRPYILDEDIDAIVEMAQSHLGPDYDLVKEDDHLHLEYDPKGAPK